MIRERRLSLRREDKGKEDTPSLRADNIGSGGGEGGNRGSGESQRVSRNDNKGGGKNDDVNNQNNNAVPEDPADARLSEVSGTPDRLRPGSRRRRSTSCVSLGGVTTGPFRGRRSLSIDKTSSGGGAMGKKAQRRELLEYARYQREELVVLDGSRLKSSTSGGHRKKSAADSPSSTSSSPRPSSTTTTTITLPEIKSERNSRSMAGEDGDRDEDVEDDEALVAQTERLAKGAGKEGSVHEVTGKASTAEANAAAATTTSTSGKKNGEAASRRFCSSVVAAIRSEEKSLTVTQARRAFGRFLVLLHARFDQALSRPAGAPPLLPSAESTPKLPPPPPPPPSLQPRESELKLVCTFLKRAAANFAYNFDFEAPSASAPRDQRVRFIGEQLGKFVDIYLKESVTVIRDEKSALATSDKKIVEVGGVFDFFFFDPN